MDESGDKLFPLKEQGTGMSVELNGPENFAHEVMFEEEYVHIGGQNPVFIGQTLSQNRFKFAGATLGLLILVLMGRGLWMQVVSYGHYREQAEENRLRHVYIPARRGIVRDAKGTVLAENVPSFDLQAMPWLLPQKEDEKDALLGNVGRILSVPLNDLLAVMASSTPGETLTVARDIPYDRAIALDIKVGQDPAMQLVVGSKRHYPLSDKVKSLSHLLGYVGAISPEELTAHRPEGYRQVDAIGKSGVESTYEKILRGVAGEKVYEVDSLNRVMSLYGDEAPHDGGDLRLTLDADLQAAAEQALSKELAAIKLTRGAVVALDPRDGSILALVSLPSYDDNYFSGSVSSTYYASLLKNEDHPLLPRAWAGVYPSGSTIKPVIATAGLAEKVITPNTTVNSVGGIKLGATFFPDWKAGGHGATNVRKAIAWSVNSFFYTIGGGYQNFVGLGVDRLTKWMRAFGLGDRLGLDLPGESAGFVPSKEWKEKTKGERWYVGDTYNLSIGQGDLLVTPLQVAAFTSAVANGGFKVRPHIVPASDALSTERLAEASVIETVRLGMRDTVIYGSGKAMQGLPFTVAGKTGTAQWRNDRKNHAWFAAFAPFDKPEIVVVVLIEEGNEGSTVSVPVAREILQAWWKLKGKTANSK
ncbi:MAG: penicillin-binding protein 2 [Patescibacteria group bacterium]